MMMGGALRKLALGFALCAATLAGLDVLAPPPLHHAQGVSPLAVDQNGAWLHAFATPEGRWRFAADLDEIDPVFIERLIAIEDKRFYSHIGVDPAAVLRAGVSAGRTGRIVSGASTITMQTARLLEPRPRTFRSKAIEMVRALQIERRLSKREILELYLTLTPYGGNIEGARAASLLYFEKEPKRLTDAEQALLIALPQAPEARRPDLRTENARLARSDILEKLNKAEMLSAKHSQEAKDARLPTRRAPLPRFAYHAARDVTRDHKGVVATTLDLRLQQRAEQLVARNAGMLSDGATASLLIVDNRTGEVRASVGSSSLDVDGGWIDLTNAVRSPGSALKPFIYGLAFEDGRLAPATLIDDMPRAFGDYTPENFDRSFRGEVRVSDALQHSLNLPAVAALQAVGAARFKSVIEATGIELRTKTRADKKADLALALGGAGVTARDLGTLYSGLANKGEVRPLIWVKTDEGQGPAYRLFSERAAMRISSILADAPALAGRAPAALSKNTSRIAFKTGTSYGYRDAWAAGHNGSAQDAGYTVIAWVGRADGAARPGQTGRKAAAPLLFDAFDLIGEVMGETHDGPEALTSDDDAPALVHLNPGRETAPPEIIFPDDGVELFASKKARGFALAARGGAGGYRWYVDGDALTFDEAQSRVIWTPLNSGFYDVTVVDEAGRSASSKVRIRASG